MKQILQSYKSGDLWLADVPAPACKPRGVVIRTGRSFISAGTERMLVNFAKKNIFGKAIAMPDQARKVLRKMRAEGLFSTIEKIQAKLEQAIPLGYSCAGVVDEVGQHVSGLSVGDRVAAGGAGYANHAGYNYVPRNLVVRVPDSVSLEDACCATVGSIALQGVRQCDLRLGESICVMGLGLLGLLALQLLKAGGFRVIGFDPDSRRCQLASELGADRVVSSELEAACHDFSGGYGMDAALITAATKSNEPVRIAGDICRMKGKVVATGLVGLDIPRDAYYKKELDFKLSLSYGPGRYDPHYEEGGHDYPYGYVRWTEQRNMQAFLELVAAGRVSAKALITHRFPFERALDAYDLITSGEEPYLGVVLEYPQQLKKQAVIALSADTPPPMVEGVRLGVIGAGNFAKGVLLPRIAKRADVSCAGIASGRGVAARTAGDRFGFRYCAASGDRIIADENIDAVLIATRHNTHAEYVTKALEAGKHVFVEKPLCLTMEELSDILSAVQGKCAQAGPSATTPGRACNAAIAACAGSQAARAVALAPGALPVLMVGFNRRFAPFTRKAAEILGARTGPVFASYQINAGRVPMDSWVQDPKQGGGRIIGELCHFVDTLRFLCAAPVSSVQAACIRTGDRTQASRDSVAVTLSYTDGSVGVINYHALGSRDYPKERLELSAARMTLVIDDFRRLQLFGSQKKRFKQTQDKGFDTEIAAFIQSIMGGGLPIPLAELVETTLVTFAIHEALNTGRPIFLDEFAEKQGLPKIQSVVRQ